MQFSRRLEWHAESNAITRAIADRRAGGVELLDLTLSNPTSSGFLPPPELADVLGRGATLPYQPHPRGSGKARLALSEWLARHGAEDAGPEDLVLTSSTSEGYSWLLKLLCNPGDRVVRFTPTYPLLDHLCALESAPLNSLELEKTTDRWHLPDERALRESLDGSKAVIVVHPNNPTGHFLSREEVESLSSATATVGAALIADEVFFEFSHLHQRRVASDSSCLTFSLGGLSKSVGFPHWKLGWIRVSGPRPQKEAALAALEMIADTYLPVSGAVQNALPEVLAMSEKLRRPIEERLATNLGVIDAALENVPAIRREELEGGWSAVLRVPVLEDEETIVLKLIRLGVLVHPGYFYDFPREGWLVVSLLSRTEELRRGMKTLIELLGYYSPGRELGRAALELLWTEEWTEEWTTEWTGGEADPPRFSLSFRRSGSAATEESRLTLRPDSPSLRGRTKLRSYGRTRLIWSISSSRCSLLRYDQTL